MKKTLTVITLSLLSSLCIAESLKNLHQSVGPTTAPAVDPLPRSYALLDKQRMEDPLVEDQSFKENLKRQLDNEKGEIELE